MNELTKLEKEILDELTIITDGFGEEDTFIYDCLKEDGYNMKIVRGILSSLEKKGKIFFDEDYIGNTIIKKYIYIN